MAARRGTELRRAQTVERGPVERALVLVRAGRIDEARAELECAVAIFERKRCLPYAERVGRQIDSLAATSRRAFEYEPRGELRGPRHDSIALRIGEGNPPVRRRSA